MHPRLSQYQSSKGICPFRVGSRGPGERWLAAAQGGIHQMAEGRSDDFDVASVGTKADRVKGYRALAENTDTVGSS